LKVRPAAGLTSIEARSSLERFGPKALEEKKRSAWRAFLSYFLGPIPWMIEAAALMALIIRDLDDCTIITTLLLFNALLGFCEERVASNALQALKNSFSLKARVLRDGKWEDVDAKTLVLGESLRESFFANALRRRSRIC
jgi:H+-transporting ATPase